MPATFPESTKYVLIRWGHPQQCRDLCCVVVTSPSLRVRREWVTSQFCHFHQCDLGLTPCVFLWESVFCPEKWGLWQLWCRLFGHTNDVVYVHLVRTQWITATNPSCYHCCCYLALQAEWILSSCCLKRGCKQNGHWRLDNGLNQRERCITQFLEIISTSDVNILACSFPHPISFQVIS